MVNMVFYYTTMCYLGPLFPREMSPIKDESQLVCIWKLRFITEDIKLEINDTTEQQEHGVLQQVYFRFTWESLV